MQVAGGGVTPGGNKSFAKFQQCLALLNVERPVRRIKAAEKLPGFNQYFAVNGKFAQMLTAGTIIVAYQLAALVVCRTFMAGHTIGESFDDSSRLIDQLFTDGDRSLKLIVFCLMPSATTVPTKQNGLSVIRQTQ
ncbi:hypothetical protein D3C85_860620 [compost metagenome]